MKLLLVLSILQSVVYADIGLKLRQQQQQYLQSRGLNIDDSAKNNPFFIPKNEVGNFGAAATNVEQRAANNGRTERTHTLEELCNDAFHSFLCKPVNSGKRRRIDGNLRPGAVLPPGFLRPESSNTRENKLLPPQQSASAQSPNRVIPSINRQPNDLQVPSAQNEQGYFYPKPSNTFQNNRPLQNGYLPPDNGFRFTPPPTVQTTRLPFVTTPAPQTTPFPPITFPSTTRPPFTTSPPTRPAVPNNFNIRFQTTPPTLITRRPTTVFTTPRPIFTQPIKYEQPRQPVFNTYLPPVTSTLPPQTTRVPFFTQPTPSPPVFTTRLPPPTRPPPPPTRPPPPPPTFSPIRLTSTFRPFTFPPVTVITSTPKYQTIANTYLPPLAEQKFNPITVTTSTPRPTFQTVPFNQFQTFNTISTNTYLPPDNPAIDVRFGSASNTREGSALLPAAAQTPSVAVKQVEEHSLERLCNDPFHSFLCQPITRTRYRFDGNLRPQAIIPSGVLIPSNSFNIPIKTFSELQSGSEPLPTRLPVNLQPSAQSLLGYVYPTPSQQTLLLPASANAVSSTGYFYPVPADNALSSVSSTLLESSQNGYEYPKPSDNQRLVISTTLAPEISTVTEQFPLVSTTPKPFVQSNPLLEQNNLFLFQNTNNQPSLVTSTEKANIETGYDYPKPSVSQKFSLPSSQVSSISGGYVYPKTETEFIFTTTTVRPSSSLDTSTPIASTFKYQPTGPQITLFTGYENSNPIKQEGVSISTTERPSTLVYEFQNSALNQISPSLSPQTFTTYQNPSNQVLLSTVSTQDTGFIGYNYPKPVQPLQEQQTNDNAQGYFYPKPSSNFLDNSLNNVGNVQLFKNSQIPNFNSFSKGISFSLNQKSPTPTSIADQLSSDQGADPRTAKNINQLLGPSNEATSRDLPPASQFEVLKVRKRQNG